MNIVNNDVIKDLIPQYDTDYRRLTPETQWGYVNAIREICSHTLRFPGDVLQHAATLAAAPGLTSVAERCIAYYIIGKGRARLEGQMGGTPRRNSGSCGNYFVGACALLFVVLLALGAWFLASVGIRFLSIAHVLFVPIAAWLSIMLVQSILLARTRPAKLPAYNFDLGVPTSAKTVVTVPLIINRFEDIVEAVVSLEVNIGGNSDANVIYVILTDLADARSKNKDGDEVLLAKLDAEIGDLSARLSNRARILHLHRERSYNSVAGIWMGWERKRGKLLEFNQLLLTGEEGDFHLRVGERSWLRDAVYVLTLDSDARLDAGGVRRLAGISAHPLNRPELKNRRVMSGFVIIQPRVVVSEGDRTTFFARVCASTLSCGASPHKGEGKDFYQDCLGRILYGGRGIYDVRAFQESIADRFPENIVLAHDQIEGMLAPAALATNVRTWDSCPQNLLTWRSRQHRWMRGDIQSSPWVFLRRGLSRGVSFPFALTLIERVNIATNLVQHATPVCIFVIAVGAWTGLLGGHGQLIATCALGLLFAPAVAASVCIAVQLPQGELPGSRLQSLLNRARSVATAMVGGVLYGLLRVILLADCVANVSHAAALAIYRLLINRKNGLEWVAASTAVATTKTDLGAYLIKMRATLGLGLIASLLIYESNPQNFLPALPVLGAWCTSPFIAYLTGLPVNKRNRIKTPHDSKTATSECPAAD